MPFGWSPPPKGKYCFAPRAPNPNACPPALGNHDDRLGAAGDWGRRIVFTGGTDNPYNFNGVGYDGRPSEAVATTFAFNLDRQSWETLPDDPHPSMDHRGLARTREGLVVVGGMENGQKVGTRVSLLRIPER